MKNRDLSRFSELIAELEKANLELQSQSNLLKPHRKFTQPVHVLYGGAHLFKSSSITKLSKLAQESFAAFITDASKLNSVLDTKWSGEFSSKIFDRVSKKLRVSPIEDFRIDFEDGYGMKSDADEDLDAKNTADQLAKGVRDGAISSSIGIRIKSLSTPLMKRSLRTLGVFLETLLESGVIKENLLRRFTVTLPKVTNEVQVSTLAIILENFERENGLQNGFFQIELLIEAPEAILGFDGRIKLPRLIAAARGRCSSLHLGVYDLNSSLGMGSAGQDVENQICHFVRHWMLLACGLTDGVSVSDGIINILPIPPHKVNADKALTESQMRANEVALTNAWRYNYTRMLASLHRGFYQGWDLHPTQVVIRHIANHVYVFQEFDHACARIVSFTENVASASRVGSVFDDRASVLGLYYFVQRSLNSHVITQEDLVSAGVDWELFQKLLAVGI